MTVLGISSKCDISLNMTYHKIHELEKLRLLHVSGDIDQLVKDNFIIKVK